MWRPPRGRTTAPCATGGRGSSRGRPPPPPSSSQRPVRTGRRNRWAGAAGGIVAFPVALAIYKVGVGVPPLIAFGVILALLYEKTGSIVPGILLHMLNNSVALLGQ